MERLSCLLCGSPHRRVLWRIRHDKFLRATGSRRIRSQKVICTTCSFIYHDPQFSITEIRYLHGDEARASVLGLNGLAPTGEYVYWKRLKAQKDVEWFETHVPIFGSKRLLEVGCAEGTLLSILRERGWIAVGVEATPAYAEYGRQVYGLDVITGFFEDLDFVPGSFDVVLLLLTLEHVKSPLDMLTTIREILAPHGVLYIQLPNALTPTDSPAHFLGAHHLFLFTPVTAVAFLEKAGFTVLVHDDSDQIWRAIARRCDISAKHPLPAWDEAAFFQMRKILRRFRRRYMMERLWRSVRRPLRRAMMKAEGKR